MENFTAMRGRFRNRRIGASPTAVSVPHGAEATRIVCHLYGPDFHDVREKMVPAPPRGMRWIDVHGLQDETLIVGIARELGLGDLAIADLFHVDQRPHTEVFGERVQTVLRMPAGGPPFASDQITLVLGPDFVLSVRERERDCLERVRRRLVDGSGSIRSSSGHLFHAIVDATVESYFPVLERYGDGIDALEERILDAPQDGAMQAIHVLKRDLLMLRHAIWPLRDAIGALQRDDAPQIGEALLPYLRDCSDHAFQLLDIVEIYRETAQGLVDLQLSSLSNRMNEIMKVLTMIATVFIPMTFIAGLYGMNFDRASPWNLPELGWRFGYAYALALMLGTATAMLGLFWRLGWIGRRRKFRSSTERERKDEDNPKDERKDRR